MIGFAVGLCGGPVLEVIDRSLARVDGVKLLSVVDNEGLGEVICSTCPGFIFPANDRGNCGKSDGICAVESTVVIEVGDTSGGLGTHG